MRGLDEDEGRRMNFSTNASEKATLIWAMRRAPFVRQKINERGYFNAKKNIYNGIETGNCRKVFERRYRVKGARQTISYRFQTRHSEMTGSIREHGVKGL